VNEPFTVALAKGVSGPVEGAEKKRVYFVKGSVASQVNWGRAVLSREQASKILPVSGERGRIEASPSKKTRPGDIR
jgi:hypothetical protein